MNQLIPFSDTSISASTQVSEDVTGGAITRLLFDFEADIQLSAGGDAAQAGAAALASDVKITSNGSVIATITGTDLFYLAEFLNSGTSGLVRPEASGSNNAHTSIDLAFGAIMPGAALDASGGNRIGYRVDYGAATQYDGNATAINSGTLRVQSEHPGGVASGAVLIPRFQYQTQLVESANSNIVVDKVFENPGHLMGVMIRAVDSSADVGVQEVDGLIKRLTVRRLPATGSPTEMFDGTWPQLKALTNRYFGRPTLADGSDNVIGERSGVVFFPTQSAGGRNRAMPIQRNDKVQLRFDSSGTAAGHLTNVAPASGDKVYVTWIFFEGALAGPADQAQRGIAPVGSNAGRSRTRRGRRRV